MVRRKKVVDSPGDPRAQEKQFQNERKKEMGGGGSHNSKHFLKQKSHIFVDY